MRPPAPKPPPGIDVEDIRIGEGTPAMKGDVVVVRCTGRLNRGDLFWDNQTITICLGQRRCIAGLERGVEGMKPGGIRRLRVSPHLGYGDKGLPGVIPANAVLVLDVEMLTINGYPK